MIILKVEKVKVLMIAEFKAVKVMIKILMISFEDDKITMIVVKVVIIL